MDLGMDRVNVPIFPNFSRRAFITSLPGVPRLSWAYPSIDLHQLSGSLSLPGVSSQLQERPLGLRLNFTCHSIESELGYEKFLYRVTVLKGKKIDVQVWSRGLVLKFCSNRIFWSDSHSLAVVCFQICKEVKELEGVVKRWLDMRGYGFIQTDEMDKDIFVHHESLKNRRSLREGEKVRFEIQETEKGPKAIDVEVIE